MNDEVISNNTGPNIDRKRVCVARQCIVCEFSFVHIWALKIPYLAKDASSEKYTLAGKRIFVTPFPSYHCTKAIGGAYGVNVWTRCTWNGCMSCSRIILHLLKQQTLTAFSRLRELALGVSDTCWRKFYSMAGVHAVHNRSQPALWN